jgi:hypothetical protein
VTGTTNGGRPTDAQKHIFVADFEQVRTGHIFSKRNTFYAVSKKVADILPIAFQILALGNTGHLTSEDGIISITLEPAIRIP